MTPTLESHLRDLVAARRALSAAVNSEESVWRDAKSRRIRERHLEPLVEVLRRFEADVSTTSAAVATALRRLEEGNQG